MGRKNLSRAFTIGAGAMALVLATSNIAYADDMTLRYPYDRGYIHYTDNGDDFKVCDTRADGYGVRGTLWYVDVTASPDRKSYLASENDGGDAGCDTFQYDVLPHWDTKVQYQMSITWEGGGSSTWGVYFDEED